MKTKKKITKTYKIAMIFLYGSMAFLNFSIAQIIYTMKILPDPNPEIIIIFILWLNLILAGLNASVAILFSFSLLDKEK